MATLSSTLSRPSLPLGAHLQLMFQANSMDNEAVTQSFSASVWQEGKWFVSQCLEVDVASQGKTEEEALANLREALTLHFQPPTATDTPKIATVQVDVRAA